MPLTIRNATPEDAALLVRIIDMASDGVVPALWSEMSPPGMDAAALGHALVTAQDGDFSYRNGFIAEQDGVKIGGFIGYPLSKTPRPVDPNIPQVFVGIEELANLVPGYWYINVMAVVPESRRHGLGAAMLNKAETQARGCASAGLALIVAASNENAIRVYQRDGYTERARRPFDLSIYGKEPTEAVLMAKDWA
ncbi:MAG: GNAT family N-acetyltransferase [Roseovarius sp.]